MTAPVDVLAVMDADAEAANDCRVSHDGMDERQTAVYAAESRQARAAVAELVEAANRAERFIANVPTDEQLDARMQSGDTGRKAYGSLRAALAKFERK